MPSKTKERFINGFHKEHFRNETHERSITMKRFLSLALTLGVVALAGSAYALNPSDISGGDPAAGIMNTRHNLGATGPHWRTSVVSTSATSSETSTGTTEVCIFCHTPHHGGQDGPLWNRSTRNGTSYVIYGSKISGGSTGETIGGSQVSTIGAASLACLSCHDGTIAFDSLINAPGKGNDGSNWTSAMNLGWTFTEDGTDTTSVKKMTSNRLNLGTDLTNDHPISVVYSDDRASLRPVSTSLTGLDMTRVYGDAGGYVDTDSLPAITATDNRWALKGYVDSGTGTIQDLLRESKVECSSCHDPHFDNKYWTEAEETWGGEDDANGHFLRRVGGNSLSGVCRTCHNK
jgi:hypothetical protein